MIAPHEPTMSPDPGTSDAERPADAGVPLGVPSGAAAARDLAARARFATDFETTFVVEAGAGTGKTTLIIARLLVALARGVATPDSLVALTFTERAAAELAVKLRQTLEQARAGAVPAPFDSFVPQDLLTTPEARARLGEAVRRFERASILTIHAFCAAVLREHPLAARLDPAFTVEQDAAEFLSAVRAAWFGAADDDADADGNGASPPDPAGVIDTEAAGAAADYEADYEAVSPAARQGYVAARELGISQDRFVELAASLLAHHDMLDALCGLGPVRRVATLAAQVRAAVAEARAFYRDNVERPRQAIARYLDGSLRRLETWLDLPEPEFLGWCEGEPSAFEERLDPGAGVYRGPPTKRAFAGGQAGCLDALHRLDRAITAAWEVYRARHREAFSALLAWLVEILRDATVTAREAGRLAYDDLLRETRDLLTIEDVRATLARRYTTIVVDEFQDVDPLQAEIVFALASQALDEGAGRPARTARPASWLVRPLTPGKLALVGDPKQSIYRFRRADIVTYQAVSEAIVAQPTGARLTIARNFRAVPGLIEATNVAFAPLFGSAEGRREQPAYRPLLATRQAPEGPPPLVFVEPPADIERARVHEKRCWEAKLIPRLIAWLTGGKGPTVVDPQNGTRRPPRFGEIAVLFPKGTGLFHSRRSATDAPDLEAALHEAHIPFSLDGGKRYYRRPEVVELITLLRLIDSPDDPVRRAAALATRALAFSDADLLRLAGLGGLGRTIDWHALTGTPFEEPLALVEALHRERHRRPYATTVQAVIDGFRLYDHHATEDVREQRARANLLKLIDRALASEQEAKGSAMHTFGAFVAALTEHATVTWRGGLGREDAELPIGALGAGAVHVLSVHKAKGLEFPVVILANLTAWTEARGLPLTIAERLPEPRLRLNIAPRARSRGGLASIGWWEAYDAETRYLDAEITRVLYVAATRARDLLIVPDLSRAGSYIDRLAPRIPPRLRCAMREQDLPEWVDPAEMDRRRAAAGAPPRESRPPAARAAAAAPADETPIPALHAERARVLAQRAEAHERALKTPAIRQPSKADGEIGVPPLTVAVDDDEFPLPGEFRRPAAAPALGTLLGAPLSSSASASGPPPEPAPGVPGSRLFGSAVHAALECFGPGDDLAPLAAAVRGLGARFRLDAEAQATLAAIVRRVHAHPVFAQARAAEVCLRELPFVAPDRAPGAPADARVEGVIDLAFLSADGWTIVDYKTTIERDLEEAAEAYAPQLALYRDALGALSERPVTRVLLLFLPPEGEPQAVALTPPADEP